MEVTEVTTARRGLVIGPPTFAISLRSTHGMKDDPKIISLNLTDTSTTIHYMISWGSSPVQTKQ